VRRCDEGCDPVAVTDLVSDWRKTWAQWGAANDARRSVTARNKIMDRIWALGREIALRPDLHEPVEALCAQTRNLTLDYMPRSFGSTGTAPALPRR